ncbi:LCP family protein [Candidatus Roizmanbacteria bacterium]|nr:LCP family protein [Candidatus Roizmanbacteria bacterium]
MYPSRRQRHIRKRVGLAIIVFLLILLGIGLFNVAKFLPALFQLAFNKEIQLKETKENRVNLLLLGVGGGTHDGPDLTDTIIFASIDPKTKNVTLVTVPRDLWVPDLSNKINTAYTFGEEKREGGGLKLAKATVGKVVGQQIDYAVKIDFSGFTKAVDMMGGLDINVANTFDDYAYPVEGKETEACGHTDSEIIDLTVKIASGSATDAEAFPCRYEHLHFDAGPTHMNGVTALKYVRSRHAEGPEGSDFARSKRQEKVISAFKEKLFSAGTLLNPVKISNLVNILQSSIETDVKEDEYDDFVKLAQKVQHGKINSISIDTGNTTDEPYGLLDNPTPSAEFNNAWVVTPRVGNGDYSEIEKYVSCRINGIDCKIGQSGILTPTPTPTKTTKK